MKKPRRRQKFVTVFLRGCACRVRADRAATLRQQEQSIIREEWNNNTLSE